MASDDTGPIPAVNPFMDEERFYFPTKGDRLGWKQDRTTKQWYPLEPLEMQAMQLGFAAQTAKYTYNVSCFVMGIMLSCLFALVVVGIAWLAAQ